MNRRLFLLSLVVAPALALAQQTSTPTEAFARGVLALADALLPNAGAAPQTFSTTVRVLRAPLREAAGREVALAYQAPDKLVLTAEIDGGRYAVGRDGGELWFHSAPKQWGLIGRPGVPRFSTDPSSVDNTVLPPFEFAEKARLVLLLTLCAYEERPAETIGGRPCRVILATPTPALREMFKISAPRIELAVPESAPTFPARIAIRDDRKLDVALEFVDTKLSAPWPAERWKLPLRAGDKIETTSVSHLARFARSALAGLSDRVPALPPPDGSRVLLGTEGRGRLELHNGVRVLFLAGTPEEMGRQHGILLKKEVLHLVDRILYGVGVGSSLAKGRWFFGEIEEAQARLHQFMDPRYLREMDAMADAAGCPRAEARLANYFPELFHCSGFALLGSATKDGRIYHGRVLDYLRGVGLEQNACVAVVRPDVGHAWVNVGYAGFIGSVTCMNEKGISIGEMGGRGEGHWDGKPMAQLLRECMEKAGTLDEALAIMRGGPRTCEYYYVIADANSKRAVGIKATPSLFEIVEAGQAHPQLPDVVRDCVLLSAGDRYTELVRRAKAGHGNFDAASARALMTRPVCMNSNIHSVLFCPDTLDFWVANADRENVASHTHYRQFNLTELLNSAPAPAPPARAQ